MRTSLVLLLAPAVLALPVAAAPSADQLAASLGWQEVPNGSVEIRVPSDARRAGVVLISRNGGWSGAFRIGPVVIGSGAPAARADVGRGRLLSLGNLFGEPGGFFDGDVALAGPVIAAGSGLTVPAGSREFVRDLGILGGRVGDVGDGTAFLAGLEFALDALPAGAVGTVEPLGFRAGFTATPPATSSRMRRFVDPASALTPRHRTFWDPARRWYLFAIEDDGSGDSDFNDTVIALELGPANEPATPRPKLALSSSVDARGGLALYGEPVELRVDVLGDSPPCAAVWIELNTELNRPRAGGWSGWTLLAWFNGPVPPGTRRTHAAAVLQGSPPASVFLGFGTHVWHANAAAGLVPVPERDWWVHPVEPDAWERSTRTFDVRAREPVRLWLAAGGVVDGAAASQPWTAFPAQDRGRLDLDAANVRRLVFHVGDSLPLEARVAAPDGNVSAISLHILDPGGSVVGSAASAAEPLPSGGLREAAAALTFTPASAGVHTVEVTAATPWAHPHPGSVVARWTLAPENRAPSADLTVSGSAVVPQAPGGAASHAVRLGDAVRLEARGEDRDADLAEVWIEACAPGGAWERVHTAAAQQGGAQPAVLPAFVAASPGVWSLRAAARDLSGATAYSAASGVEVVGLVATVARDTSGRVYPGDAVPFTARAEASRGGYAGGSWALEAAGVPVGAGTFATGAAPLFAGAFAATPSMLGTHTVRAEFVHATGLRAGASVPLVVEQGLFRHTVRARVVPSPGYEIWYDASPEVEAVIDVERPRQ